MNSRTAASVAARMRPLRFTVLQASPSPHLDVFYSPSCLVQRRPSSSMSAIVRGLRRTFRDKGERKGKRAPGYDASVAARVTERRRMRDAAPPQTFRLLRGKKDVTPEVIPEAKTRRARFFDPDDSFGKKSLVYQVKTGQLEKEVQELAKHLGKDGQEERGERSGRGNRGRGDRDRDDQDRGDRRDRDRGNRGAYYERDGHRPSQPPRQRATWGRDEGERDNRVQETRGDARPDRRTEPRGDRFPHDSPPARRDNRARRDQPNGGDDRGGRAAEVPLAIPFTTAASQFLYGRSVVEAALRSGRRRLYKLYVYEGSNRGGFGGSEGAERRSFGKQERLKEQQHADALERIARRKGVQVQHVGDSWQRVLDKMSKGRPHNGYVLEASPLPQPPLVALGAWAADRGGFSLALGHQSREEADVNGTVDFVSVGEKDRGETDAEATSATTPYKPLVLLLDQVLDPGNLGGILRSASFLGVRAVVISKHSSAGLTPVALKAAAGAAETMTLFSVDAPAVFLAQSRAAGWKVYAAVPPEEQQRAPSSSASAPSPRPTSRRRLILDLDDVETADPLRREACILVVGSEGEGLPRAIRREADVDVSIANRSGADVVDSLNVSVATGLLCASFLKGPARHARGTVRKRADEPADKPADKPADALGIW